MHEAGRAVRIVLARPVSSGPAWPGTNRFERFTRLPREPAHLLA
jgi:hypothetical protein